MAEQFKNENDVDTKPRIVRFFSYLTMCLIYGLFIVGCVTIIVFLCKMCYNIITL